MLKQRILTAAILIPIFIFLLFKLPLKGFSLLTALVVFWAATEWSVLMQLKTRWARWVYTLIIAAGLIIAYFLPASFYVLYAASAWWIIALAMVIAYPRMSHVWSKNVVLRGLMGFLVLIPCWLAINYIRYSANGAYILLFLFVLIWGADIAAFFVGRQWGRRKLAPAVSPGKSWEGLLGAVIMTFIIVIPLGLMSKMPALNLMGAIALSVLTVLFSVVGDLFESMLKRNAGLKDSGTLLPGHGGILDRIDSLTAAAPIFVVGLIVMSKLYYALA